MRFIQFRGKIDDLWAYANPENTRPPDSSGYWDWEQFWHCVDMDTVGQYTGIKDRNGQEIYEGDIVNIQLFNNAKRAQVVWGLSKPLLSKWDWGETWMLQFEDTQEEALWPYSHDPHKEDIEIIGNVYDNPELVKR